MTFIRISGLVKINLITANILKIDNSSTNKQKKRSVNLEMNQKHTTSKAKNHYLGSYKLNKVSLSWFDDK